MKHDKRLMVRPTKDPTIEFVMVSSSSGYYRKKREPEKKKKELPGQRLKV